MRVKASGVSWTGEAVREEAHAVEEAELWSNVVIVDKFSSPHLPSEDYFRKLKGRFNG